jgi:hypothetical protein
MRSEKWKIEVQLVAEVPFISQLHDFTVIAPDLQTTEF